MIDQLLADACNIAEQHSFERVEPEHLLYVLLRHPEGGRLLQEMGVNPDELMSNLASGFRAHETCAPLRAPRLIISDPVMRVLESAERAEAPILVSLIGLMRADGSERKISDEKQYTSARAFSATAVGEALPDLDDLLDGLEQEEGVFGFDRICKDVFPKGVRAEKGGSDTFGSDAPEAGLTEEATAPKADRTLEKPSLSSKERAEALRAVERSIRDLTELFRSGGLDRVIGREQEIDQICEVLMRRRKSNVLLVGEPGVGKTALMEGVAARVATSADPALSSRPVLQASLGALVAGARYRGDFEVRMEILIEIAQERRAILFFDEMQMLIGSGATAERGMDGANLLKPALARDGLSLVGATTHEEASTIRSDPALMRRFETVVVREPDAEQMFEILSGSAAPYLAHHRIKADARILSRIVDFADRYLQDRRFPDKAFDLLDSSCVRARRDGRSTLRVGDIRDAVRRLGGSLPSPVTQDTKERGRVREKLHVRLSARVGGHPDAISAVVDAVSARAPGTPLGFHLAGPSGVGRRTLARALGEVMGMRIREISAGYGVEETRTRLIEVIKSDVEPLILLNLDSAVDPATAALIDAALSAGSIRTATGQNISLGGTILCIRSSSQRETFGFAVSRKIGDIDKEHILKISFYKFSSESLVEGIRFELNRLSVLWSDTGTSRPIPSVDRVIRELDPMGVNWSEITRACQKVAGLDEGSLS